LEVDKDRYEGIVDKLIESGQAYDINFDFPALTYVDSGKTIDSAPWIRVLQDRIQ
jgi:hypothetical protein